MMSPEDDNLPPEVRQRLRSLDTPPVPMGQPRDADLLAAAHAYLPGKRTLAGRWRLGVAAGLAAAAAIAITVSILLPSLGRAKSHARMAYRPTGDIRDAFYVARSLKEHRPLPPVWDANHDGTIDQADVRTLALAAVRLEEKGKEGGTP